MQAIDLLELYFPEWLKVVVVGLVVALLVLDRVVQLVCAIRDFRRRPARSFTFSR